MRDDDIRRGIHRVAKGDSVNRVLHALVSKVRFGDPNELDRLYGDDFAATGSLDFQPHSEAEEDVPAFVRQRLTHHGFQHTGSFQQQSFTVHKYDHPDGSRVRVGIHVTRPAMKWMHIPLNATSMVGYGAGSLVDRLNQHHS